jgi:hypothetical protein
VFKLSVLSNLRDVKFLGFAKIIFLFSNLVAPIKDNLLKVEGNSNSYKLLPSANSTEDNCV